MAANSPKSITDAIRRMAILSPLETTELARAVGIGREHVSAFRNYRKGMGLEGLCKMADFFGVEIVVTRSHQGGEE
jgi:plasmid maintenance system antidote protein VapI